MLHPQALDSIAAFNQIPSLAFTVASPSTRLAVERHYKPHSYVTVTLDPIPSQQHVLQRTISYCTYIVEPFNKCPLSSLWWLKNKRNRCVPLALELRSCFKLSETPTGTCVQIEPCVSTEMNYLFDTTFLQAYLQLDCLQSLTIYRIRDLQWLKLLVNLEELDLRGVQAEPSEYTRISALSNLRVLTLDVNYISSLQWISGCHNLRELKLLGDASSTSQLNAISELQLLRSLSIIFLGEEEGMNWLTYCRNLEVLDLLLKRSSYPPVWSLPRLSCLRMEYKQQYKIQPYFRKDSLSLRPQPPSIEYPSRLTHVDLCYSETYNIQWLKDCLLLEMLSVRGCTNISDFTVLGCLVNLRVLDIGTTEVNSIDWISNCVALIDLNISKCFKVKDLQPIGTLKNLKMLDMQKTHDTANSFSLWISKCAQLQELNVSQSCIRWRTLSKLTMLRKLSLQSYYAYTNLDDLAPCTLLEELDLRGCFKVSDITPLVHLSRLHFLNVQNTSVTSIVLLAGCAALEKLYMDAEKVTDLQSISKFRALSYIDFGLVAVVRFRKIEKVLSELPYLRKNTSCVNDRKKRCHVTASYDPLWQSQRQRTECQFKKRDRGGS